jgi:hypothetical protein
MSYTLAEAAVACGLDKSTVRRAVRSGRISGTRDDQGVWHVEPGELHRVFPPVVRTNGDITAVPRDASADSADITTNTLVAELRGVIADLRRGQEDLRQDRDHWRDEAAHWREQAQQPALPKPEQPEARPASLWGRFMEWRRPRAA